MAEMKYEVRLQTRARTQLFNAALWWAENHSTEQAVRWLEGFESALTILAHNPERWPHALESDLVSFEIREMTYGLGRRKSHRVVFEVREKQVVVYAIRHLAQDTLTSEDLS